MSQKGKVPSYKGLKTQKKVIVVLPSYFMPVSTRQHFPSSEYAVEMDKLPLSPSSSAAINFPIWGKLQAPTVNIM